VSRKTYDVLVNLLD